MHLLINGIDVQVVKSELDVPEEALSILFVHGAGENASVWDAQEDHLRSRYSVYRIELPGHGGSSGSGEEDIRAYARLVQMALEKLFQSKPHVLVGHSMGGAIILELATNPRGAMKGIVLVATGAKLGVAPLIFQMLEENPDAFFKSTEQIAFGTKTPQDVRERVIQAMRGCRPSVISKDFKACNRFDIRDRLGELHIPTLIISGEEDQLTPLKYSEYLREKIASSRLVIIPKAGHVVMAERPEAVNQALEKFLDEI
jgi:pimeloyl-ACP methyl ester carboxylesterase